MPTLILNMFLCKQIRWTSVWKQVT